MKARKGITLLTCILVLFSMVDLTILGTGSLTDEGNYQDGITSKHGLVVTGGAIVVRAQDDGIRGKDYVIIRDGDIAVDAGGDGIKSDNGEEAAQGYVHIEGGMLNITSGRDAIQAQIVASDDGINGSGGNDGSGMMPGPGRAGGRGRLPGSGQGQMPAGGETGSGWLGQDGFATGDCSLIINGGYVAVDAYGDGIDVNGPIEMTGGVVVVSGPVENMNGALDYLGTFNISGGLLVAAGSAGMAEAPSASSGQYSLLLNLNGTARATTLIQTETPDGHQGLTFAPTKQCQSIVFSSPELQSGPTYEVSFGGSCDGDTSEGLYEGGTCTSGTEYTSFTVSDVVTWIGGRAR